MYTPAAQLRIAGLSRQMREIEASLRHTAPDWEERMARWETDVGRDQPAWVILNPTQVSEADTRFYPQKDGSILGLGYAPTKFTYVFRAETSLTEINAVRLELLNDPNLPANGPGRSFKGGCALTELRVEAADLKAPERKAALKFSEATADYANLTRPLDANFDDKTGRKRFTGAAAFAIDGKDETAWGIDAGPGRRNTDRKAVFVTAKPVRFPNGAVLTFHIKTSHGGWNNNDHQNNNLGRFRLSVTSAKDAKADPLPKRVREILDVPRERRSPRRSPRFSATGGRRYRSFRRPTTGSRPSGRNGRRERRRSYLHPGKRGTSARRLCCSEATGSSHARKFRRAFPRF